MMLTRKMMILFCDLSVIIIIFYYLCHYFCANLCDIL